jgi:predicted SprT family Zn-dependent metalloprotease
MTQNDIRSLVECLAYEFKVPKPNLRFNHSMRRAWYYPSRREIVVGFNNWTGSIIDPVLHEFAHYLTHMEVSYHEHHGIKFMERLVRVARCYYGDPKLYSWKNEYKSVKSYARSRRMV